MSVAPAVAERSELAPPGRPRSLGPIPFRDLAGLLVSCLLVVVAFSPVVFGGRTLSTAAKTYGTNGASPFPGAGAVDRTNVRPDLGASAWQMEPWADVTHRAYSDGDLPLWNPYQGTGAPHAANMQSATFDPLLLAVNLHPTPAMWDLAIIGAFVLGAAAAYLFGRVLGMSVVPAVVTSAAFSLSGWFFLYSNISWSRSYVYLPVLFLLVELVVRSRRLLPVLGLGVATAGTLYVGMPEASALVLASSAIYATARGVQERRRTRPLVAFVRLGGAGLLGLLLSAPLVLLFLQYEPLSFNIHKAGSTAGSQTDPQWGLLNWLVPFFHEPPDVVSIVVRNWFGVAIGVSALAAISGRGETRRLRAWLFVALGGAVLLKIYEFRVFDWVGRLPIIEQIKFPVFAAPVASFAFAVLAGIGVQVVWSRDLRARRFLTLLGVSSALLLVFVATDDRWGMIASAPRSHAVLVWGRAFLIAAIAIALVLLGGVYGRRWAPPLLGALVVVELLGLAPYDIYAPRADPYRPPAWMSYVRTAFRDEPHARVFGLDGKLYPDTAGALGLQDIRALDALYVDRYLRYVKTFLAPRTFDRFTGTEPPVVFRNNPMFDALAVRAIVTQTDIPTSTGLSLIGRSGSTRVYENTSAYPRAWIVHRVHVVRSEDEAFAFLRARSRRVQGAFVVGGFDPRHEAVVERRATSETDALGGLRSSSASCAARKEDRVGVERYAATSVTLSVDAACPGVLVLPDTYFPGWSATVNGRRATIYPTDGAFRGVAVPAGASRVEFHYAPQPFRAGVMLAMTGMAGFLLLAAASTWRVRRRREDPAPSTRSESSPSRAART